MAKIEDPPKARRLAGAIVTDLQLYQQEKLAMGLDISAELDEGRRLYRSRVAPALHAVFEEVARGRLGARMPAASEPPAEAPAAAAAARPAWQEPAPTTPTGRAGTVGITFAIVALAGVLGYFLLLRH